MSITNSLIIQSCIYTHTEAQSNRGILNKPQWILWVCYYCFYSSMSANLSVVGHKIECWQYNLVQNCLPNLGVEPEVAEARRLKRAKRERRALKGEIPLSPKSFLSPSLSRSLSLLSLYICVSIFLSLFPENNWNNVHVYFFLFVLVSVWICQSCESSFIFSEKEHEIPQFDHTEKKLLRIATKGGASHSISCAHPFILLLSRFFAPWADCSRSLPILPSLSDHLFATLNLTLCSCHPVITLL